MIEGKLKILVIDRLFTSCSPCTISQAMTVSRVLKTIVTNQYFDPFYLSTESLYNRQTCESRYSYKQAIGIANSGPKFAISEGQLILDCLRNKTFVFVDFKFEIVEQTALEFTLLKIPSFLAISLSMLCRNMRPKN